MTIRNNGFWAVVQMGLLAWSGATWAADQVYVANEGADTVSVLDAASFQVVRKIAVGAVPTQLYATPDSRTLLVANQGTRQKPGNTVSLIDLERFKVANTVSVMDLKDRRVAKTVPVGKTPNGISATP